MMRFFKHQPSLLVYAAEAKVQRQNFSPHFPMWTLPLIDGDINQESVVKVAAPTFLNNSYVGDAASDCTCQRRHDVSAMTRNVIA